MPASPAAHSGVGALPGLGIISSELGSKHAPPPSTPACTEPHSLWAAVGAHPLVLGHPGVLQGNHFVILTLTLKDASERWLLELALSVEPGTLHSLSLSSHPFCGEGTIIYSHFSDEKTEA